MKDFTMLTMKTRQVMNESYIQETFLQSHFDVGFNARPLFPFAPVALHQSWQRVGVAHRVRR